MTPGQVPEPGSAEYYVIRIGSRLDGCWADWFAGLALTYTAGGDTLLTGALPDQAALHGVLARIRDLNVPLISVQRITGPGEGRGEVPSSRKRG